MKRFLVTLLSFLFANICFSQYFSSGEDPARVQYSYINTPHFNVVFPIGADAYAFRLASMLEQSFRNVQFSPLFKTKNINVLLHTRNSNSNGFVSWAPRRMELMTLPPFEFGPLSWDRDLAIHEFRHVSQISSLYNGLTGLSYYVLGEQGIGSMTSLIPLWFYEGDAVYAETAFSNSGRGRNSNFTLAYRARLSQGCKLNFDQYLNGSYKTFIPNHYELGYLLTSYARIKYGQNVWDSVVRYTTRNPFLMASFSFGIRKYTGQTRKKLFNNAVSFFDSTWSASISNKSVKELNKRCIKEYLNYCYPIVVDSNLYSFKLSLDRNPMLVRHDKDGVEYKIRTVGSVNSAPTSNGCDIFWTEYANVGRWAQEKFSVLKRFSVKTNRVSLVSDFGYYSYPAVKGDTVAVIKNTPTNKIVLGIYSLDFEPIKAVNLEFNQVKDLQWVGSELAYTALDKFDNMIVVKQSVDHGHVDTLFNFGRRNMGGVKVVGDSIFFTSDFSGKSDLYSYCLSTNTLEKLYESTCEVGNYSISGNTIVVTDYSIDGFKLKKVGRNKGVACSLENPKFPIAAMLSTMEGNLNLQDSVLYKSDFKVKRYYKFSHLFNFHSWAPFYFDPSAVQDLDLTIYPGFTLISQNLLNTSFTSIAYGYKENSHIVDLSYTYKGWLPVFNFRMNRYSGMPRLFSVKGFKYERDSSERRMKFGLSAYLPIQFSYGAWSGLIQPYADLSHYNDILLNESTQKYEKGFDELTTSFYASWQMKLAHQNIFPRWGMNFYFKMTSAPFEKGNLGELYAYRLGFMVPGVLPNHGLMTRWCYQKQVIDRYLFSNAFILPRGYNSSSFSSYKYQALFADYSFPVAYPDFNLSWLVYLKRVRANLFADVARRNYWKYKKAGSPEKVYFEEDYASFGTDILFDFNALRSTFPMTSGIRLAYNNNKTMTWNYFFSIRFN